MNRTIKDATVKRYFYETHDQLRTHLRDFVGAYNFARRLKTLRGLGTNASIWNAPGCPRSRDVLGALAALRRLTSGRLMRIFGPIVLPSPAVVQVVDAEIEGCCAVGPQIMRDQSIRNDGIFP